MKKKTKQFEWSKGKTERSIHKEKNIKRLQLQNSHEIGKGMTPLKS